MILLFKQTENGFKSHSKFTNDFENKRILKIICQEKTKDYVSEMWCWVPQGVEVSHVLINK